MAKDRFFVETETQNPVFFWWKADAERMFIRMRPPNDEGWEQDIWTDSPETVNIMWSGRVLQPGDEGYVAEIDSSIIYFEFKEVPK